MAKQFLSGIKVDFITDLDDPIFPTDAANKQWVEALIGISSGLPTGGLVGDKLVKLSGNDYDVGWVADTSTSNGGHASIHGGYFTSNNNANIHGGHF